MDTLLLSDFTDPRFCTAFRTYFAELDIPVSDWDGLFQEMNAEGNNFAYLQLAGNVETVGFLLFQLTHFSHWFFEEPFGFLREFWVAPPYRRQGHGKSLLLQAETYFLTHGVHRSILTADNAANFYLANGYHKASGITAKNHMEVFFKNLS